MVLGVVGILLFTIIVLLIVCILKIDIESGVYFLLRQFDKKFRTNLLFYRKIIINSQFFSKSFF